MPALPLPVDHLLLNRNASGPAATLQAASPPDVGLPVVCAWPVSGQYGPGVRIVYYGLVAACIFARHIAWLRNACLAAVLLLPAVAAIHGIVLAAVHQNGGVDMDIFGAFQLCAIGILAAPVTVRLSKTYFEDPGRNLIFAWSSLLLAGLISMTVEFYRTNTIFCAEDNGTPISRNPKDFPYGTATCGLTCNITAGPYSPIRRGSGNNIDVIPAPTAFPFSTATIISAGCCIPAVLLSVAMWVKILETKSRRIHAALSGSARPEGTPQRDPKWVKRIRQLFEVPLFAAATFTILILGERNLWSPQVLYDNENIANVGQWASVVGIGLGIAGSLYLLLAKAIDEERKSSQHNSSSASPTRSRSRSPGARHRPHMTREHSETSANRADYVMRRIVRFFVRLGDAIDDAARHMDNQSLYREEGAQRYPRIPGEESRNAELRRVETGYSQRHPSTSTLEMSRTGSRSGSRDGRPSRSGSMESHRSRDPSVDASAPQTPVKETSRRKNTLELPSPVRRHGSDPTSPLVIAPIPRLEHTDPGNFDGPETMMMDRRPEEATNINSAALRAPMIFVQPATRPASPATSTGEGAST